MNFSRKDGIFTESYQQLHRDDKSDDTANNGAYKEQKTEENDYVCDPTEYTPSKRSNSIYNNYLEEIFE